MFKKLKEIHVYSNLINISLLLSFGSNGMWQYIMVITSHGMDRKLSAIRTDAGIILCMRLVNERRRYIVTSSLIGWAHAEWSLCWMVSFIVNRCIHRLQCATILHEASLAVSVLRFDQRLIIFNNCFIKRYWTIICFIVVNTVLIGGLLDTLLTNFGINIYRMHG